jgi:regulator of RNase E activity RraA
VTVAAKAAGARAGVVDGPCTDLEEVGALAFPLRGRGLTRIYDLGGRMNVPVAIGGVVVSPGNAVPCGESGVLVLPPGEAEEARAAIARQERGPSTPDRVAKGEKLGDISGATVHVLAGS